MNILSIFGILGLGAAAFAYFFIFNKSSIDGDASSDAAAGSKASKKPKKKKGKKVAAVEAVSNTLPVVDASLNSSASYPNLEPTPIQSTTTTTPLANVAAPSPKMSTVSKETPIPSSPSKASKKKAKAIQKAESMPKVDTVKKEDALVPPPPPLVVLTPDMAPQKPQLPAKLETPQPSPQEAVSSSNSSDDEEGRASRILRLKSSDRDLSASEEAEDGWMVVKDVPKKAPALRILPASSPKTYLSASSSSSSAAPVLTKTQRANIKKAEKAKAEKKALQELQEQRQKEHRKAQQKEHLDKLAKEERDRAFARALAQNGLTAAAAKKKKEGEGSGAAFSASGSIWD